MKIAIEAQRIFRPNKHGMDFVAIYIYIHTYTDIVEFGDKKHCLHYQTG